jgi:hypothetical protein
MKGTPMPKKKVLSFDIETSPLIAYTWTEWLDGQVIEVIQDYQILTIAWKWLGEKTIHCLGQDDFPDYKPGTINDKSLLKAFREVLNDADVVVAHNGDQFDVKKLNARMIIQGLAPYSPVKQYDTKKAAKRIGGFTSNRLGRLAKDLNVASKGDPGGFGTWKGCMAGDPKAWAKMKKYNRQDIPPLEDLYVKFAPWDKQSPSLNVLEDRPDACPNCLGTHIQARGLSTPTKTGRKQRYVCMDCGKWLQGRKTVQSGVQFVS